MALRARAKQVAARLDSRFPLFRDLIRKSGLFRKLLRRSGVVKSRMLRSHVDFFSLPPMSGLPKYAKFNPPVCGERVHVLFGATHELPALHRLQAAVVFTDERNAEVLRYKSGFITQSPIMPPWALHALLPDCVYWYERVVDDVPTRWDTLNVRFNSSSTLPGPDDLPPGFRFHCVLAHAVGGESDARVVDLPHAGPYAWNTMKGDA